MTDALFGMICQLKITMVIQKLIMLAMEKVFRFLLEQLFRYSTLKSLQRVNVEGFMPMPESLEMIVFISKAEMPGIALLSPAAPMGLDVLTKALKLLVVQRFVHYKT